LSALSVQPLPKTGLEETAKEGAGVTHRAIDNLVNAQVDVNRAVFEANEEKGPAREDYLRKCIAGAIFDLTKALQKLRRPA
jgi:hypothetical protein